MIQPFPYRTDVTVIHLNLQAGLILKSVIAICILLVVLAGCSSGDQVPEEKYRVLLIGIDGGSWDFINPMMDRGLLPNFKKFINDGASGRLQSIYPYVTPPGWTSLFTGQRPGKTGIYGFGFYQPNNYEFRMTSSRDVRSPRIWDILGSKGLKSGSVCVPVTFPVEPVNGIQISGVLTPYGYAEPRIQEVQNLKTSENGDNLTGELHCFDTVFKIVSDMDTATLTPVNESPDWPGKPVRLKSGEKTPWLPVRISPDNMYPLILKFIENDRENQKRAWVKLTLEDISSKSIRFKSHIVVPDLRDLPFNITWPPTLAVAINDIDPIFIPSITSLDDDTTLDLLRRRGSVARELYTRDEYDFFTVVYHRSDTAGHTNRLSFVEQIYTLLDKELEQWMNLVDDKTVVIIASDHGFNQKQYRLDLNRWLEESGIMVPASDSSAVSYDPGSYGIDYSRTRAYHRMWGIYFNLAGRDPMGLVNPGEEEDQLILDLQKAAETLNQEAGFEVLSLKSKWEIFSGHALSSAPDIIPIVSDRCETVYWESARQPEVLQDVDGGILGHSIFGIVAMNGPVIARGKRLKDCNIEDITPTILHLCGQPVARDFDGSVILPAFVREYSDYFSVKFVDTYNTLLKEIEPDGTSIHGSESSLMDQLKSLGYMQ